MSNLRKTITTSATALVATAIVVAAMLWLSGCFRRGRIEPGRLPPPRPAAAAATVPVQRVSRPQMAEVVGSIEAEQRTTISPRIMAHIVDIRVRSGDRVKKGDLLVELDDRDLSARLGQARQSLRASEATRDLAKIELDRLQQLAERKVASESEVDQWRARHAAAAADVLRAQQAVSEAEVLLSHARIVSPIDGIVIDRHAEPGDQAETGRALLTLYDPSRMRMEAAVREAYIGRLKIGQPITVFVDALGQHRTGTVDQIVPAADPASRSFIVKVRLADSTGLYPGMFARMRIPLGEEPRLEIPTAAVRQVGQLALVDVLADGRAHRRAVRLGRIDGDRVEVLAGLQEGEAVVVDNSGPR